MYRYSPKLDSRIVLLLLAVHLCVSLIERPRVRGIAEPAGLIACAESEKVRRHTAGRTFALMRVKLFGDEKPVTLPRSRIEAEVGHTAIASAAADTGSSCSSGRSSNQTQSASLTA